VAVPIDMKHTLQINRPTSWDKFYKSTNMVLQMFSVTLKLNKKHCDSTLAFIRFIVQQ
jgi:hypothetical protein